MSAQAALKYFVDLMNSYTKELGMKNSHFANPDGFPDSNHYTTAGDMIIIAVKAYSFSLIRNVVNQPWATAYFESGGSASYTNSNETINPYSDRYYPYMVGIKTGSHSLADNVSLPLQRKRMRKQRKQELLWLLFITVRQNTDVIWTLKVFTILRLQNSASKLDF